jgi:polar amino acid transport system substrate-binding protein
MLGRTQPAFFAKVDHPWTFAGVGSLDAIRLGVIQDYTYEAKLDRYIHQNRNTARIYLAKGNDALQRLISLVLAGRIDTFVENAPVVYYTLSQMGIGASSLRECGSPKQGVDLYLPFSPKMRQSKTWAQQFDEGIERLRKTGQLEKILRPYNLKPWFTQAIGGVRGGK